MIGTPPLTDVVAFTAINGEFGTNSTTVRFSPRSRLHRRPGAFRFVSGQIYIANPSDSELLMRLLAEFQCYNLDVLVYEHELLIRHVGVTADTMLGVVEQAIRRTRYASDDTGRCASARLSADELAAML